MYLTDSNLLEANIIDNSLEFKLVVSTNNTRSIAIKNIDIHEVSYIGYNENSASTTKRYYVVSTIVALLFFIVGLIIELVSGEVNIPILMVFIFVSIGICIFGIIPFKRESFQEEFIIKNKNRENIIRYTGTDFNIEAVEKFIQEVRNKQSSL